MTSGYTNMVCFFKQNELNVRRQLSLIYVLITTIHSEQTAVKPRSPVTRAKGSQSWDLSAFRICEYMCSIKNVWICRRKDGLRVPIISYTVALPVKRGPLRGVSLRTTLASLWNKRSWVGTRAIHTHFGMSFICRNWGVRPQKAGEAKRIHSVQV